MEIKDRLPGSLQGDHLVNLANNYKVSRDVISVYQTMSKDEIQSDFTPAQLSSFIRNGCAHFSSLSDKQVTENWSSIEFDTLYKVSVDTSLTARVLTISKNT